MEEKGRKGLANRDPPHLLSRFALRGFNLGEHTTVSSTESGGRLRFAPTASSVALQPRRDIVMLPPPAYPGLPPPAAGRSCRFPHPRPGQSHIRLAGTECGDRGTRFNPWLVSSCAAASEDMTVAAIPGVLDRGFRPLPSRWRTSIPRNVRPDGGRSIRESYFLNCCHAHEILASTTGGGLCTAPASTRMTG